MASVSAGLAPEEPLVHVVVQFFAFFMLLLLLVDVSEFAHWV